MNSHFLIEGICLDLIIIMVFVSFILQFPWKVMMRTGVLLLIHRS